MNNLATIYLCGVVVSAIIVIIMSALKEEFRLSDLVSALINIICSWACPLSFVGIFVRSLLKRSGNDLKLWSKLSAQSQGKIIKHRH